MKTSKVICSLHTPLRIVMLCCESEKLLSRSSQLASGEFLNVLPVLGHEAEVQENLDYIDGLKGEPVGCLGNI